MLCGSLAGLSKFLIVGFSRTANAVAASVSALAEWLQHVCAGKSALMVGERLKVSHTGSQVHLHIHAVSSHSVTRAVGS